MTEGVQESTAVVEKSTANESLDNFSIHFFHPERSVCALLYENFYEFPHVSILKEDLAQIVSDTESKKSKNADCLFCPVSSTFVHLFQKAKGTGISSSQSEDDTSCEFAHQLIRHLGDPFKGNLFRKLSEEYYDEPPLGTTFIMETGAKTFPRYVAWTITDILEEEPTPLGIYNAMRSALIAVLAHNRKCTAENKLEAGIRGVASPIFGFRAANLTLENGLEVVPDAALIAMVKEMREGYASIASGHPANLATKVFILKKLLDTNLTETTSLHRENQILQEQVLSGALEARGFCTKKELAQLIAWVRLGAQSHMPKVTEASAKVLAAMIRNSDRSDFVLSREYISKQIMAPNGCFSHFFTLAQDGVFEVHNEIKKVDLEFGDTMQKNTVCSVYKGKYKGMNVAIKSYHPDLNEIPDFSKEFRAEAALMSMVQHPSLVPFLGAASRKPDFFIVTRLMKESLYDTLRDNSLDLPMLAKLMLSRQVSVAVAYLHELELVHRDLKSKNVLIGHSLDEVVLCDFGLARIVNRTEVMTSNVGTIAWIAPEVLSGQKYGEAADVYSLGIVIWEIFTRKLPFEDIPSFQIPLVVTRGDRPTIPKDMPPKVVKLLKACWDAKPQKRPPASLVVAAIDQLIVEQGGSFQSVPIRQSSSIDFSNKSTPKDSPTGSPLNTNRSHHTSTTQGNNTPHNHSPVGSRDSTMHSFQSISASSSRDSTGSAISRNSSGTATDSTKRCRASKVPIHMDSVFQPAESLVELYFNHFERTGTTVSISDERYLMLRSTSLSYEFLSVIQDCCGFKSSDDGKEFAYNLLFEFGQYVGKSDATNFAAKTAANLHLARAAVPALSHLGMGFMEIQPESSLTPDEHCLLIFREPFSFEADTYKDQTSKKTSHCVCCFNSGFVSGWMAEAYDVPLVTVELTCRARGDASCEFVMASQDKIESYTQAYIKNKPSKEQSQYSHFKMPGYIKSRLTKGDKNWFQQSVSKIHLVKEDSSSAKKKLEEAKKRMERFYSQYNEDHVKQKGKELFGKVTRTPSAGTVTISKENYIFVRGSSLTYDFADMIEGFGKSKQSSTHFYKQFMFMLAYTMGNVDSKHFAKKLKLGDHPIDRYHGLVPCMEEAGWGRVSILTQPNEITLDTKFSVVFEIENSFESDAWIRHSNSTNEKCSTPVCVMCAGYAAGWCSTTFGLNVSAVEVGCRALGDTVCRFILAEASRISHYAEAYFMYGTAHKLKFDQLLFLSKNTAVYAEAK